MRRFIPTGLGNTSDTSLNPDMNPGSSPRAWGTPDGGSCCESLLRFIPTGVGNTQERIISYGAETVHPHGRGEHVANSRNRVPISGSSPRAWGTRSSVAPPTCPTRFIPTGVGNTIRELVPEWMASVHPHGRGEHFKEPSPEKIASGSSPRAWGTHSEAVDDEKLRRFIPTGVGNTS